MFHFLCLRNILIFCVNFLWNHKGLDVLSHSLDNVKYYKIVFVLNLLGLSMATNSLIRTISPTIGGLLYTTFGFPVFGVSGTLVNGLLFTYLFVYGKESLSS